MPEESFTLRRFRSLFTLRASYSFHRYDAENVMNKRKIDKIQKMRQLSLENFTKLQSIPLPFIVESLNVSIPASRNDCC